MVRDWLTRKASKTIEAAVEPAKEAFRKTVEQKSDWGSKLLKLTLLSVLTFLAFRDGDKEPARAAIQPPVPNIIINNHIHGERSNGND